MSDLAHEAIIEELISRIERGEQAFDATIFETIILTREQADRIRPHVPASDELAGEMLDERVRASETLAADAAVLFVELPLSADVDDVEAVGATIRSFGIRSHIIARTEISEVRLAYVPTRCRACGHRADRASLWADVPPVRSVGEKIRKVLKNGATGVTTLALA